MRKLWGRANSSNVMKVIWLLEELGLPYQRIDAGGAFGVTDTPEYRAMNPNSLVPTLQEDDFVLWESNVILRYLCEANAPDSPMFPRDLHARASIDRWMDWQQTTLNGPMSPVFWGLVRTPPEQRDMDAIGRGIQATGEVLARLDAVLARVPYVVGPVFTLADMPLGVHIHRWFFFPVEKPALPHVRAWYDRLLERPAYRTHVAGPVT
ncbi:MAG: glutathione S-transferase family protein [Acetobacteraceae bacterium]